MYQRCNPKFLGAEIVTGLIQTGQVGNNARCQVASGRTLFDLDLTSLSMTDQRNITKFNPIPVLQGRQGDDAGTFYNEAGTVSVRVQFTVPDESVIATISAATGGAVPALTKPTEGWPVLVFQHGFGQSNSNAFLIASALAMVVPLQPLLIILCMVIILLLSAMNLLTVLHLIL
ncbi:MAG: hypothetical protein ACI8QG_001066 [Flavobacteriales bacterium]|jgi:hypothetical protein